MKSIAIIALISIIFVLYACKRSSAHAKDEVITIKQLVKASKATIVDVRTGEEFSGGHIEGSINIPLDQISHSLDSLKKHENIVVVCRSGNRSGKAKKILVDGGFTNIYDGKGWDTLNKQLK